MFGRKVSFRTWLVLASVLAVMTALACTKEVIKEVPVEKIVTQDVIKEVVVEVEKVVEVTREVVKEVVKEVPVEVIKEVVVIKEVPKVITEQKVVVREVAVVVTAVPVVGTAGFALKALEGNVKYGGIFREAIPVTMKSGDFIQGGPMHVISPLYNKMLQRNVMDGLRSIVPDLTEAWDVSSDGTSYTFQLRQGVTFHDGTPFNADDVVANYNRMRNPPSGITSIMVDTLAMVGTVEKVDDHTVRFGLTAPTPYFLELVSAGGSVIYSDEELAANNSDLRTVEVPVGTGPFSFADHTPLERWKLAANADYYNPALPYVDAAHVLHAVTWAERGTAVLVGQADYAFNVSRGTWNEANKRAELSVGETFSMGGHNVALNNEVAPFDDPRVRKAIHLAVSRQTQITGFRAVWEPAFVTRWVPFASPYTNSAAHILTLPGYRADKTEDIAEAKRLMAEAGYADGFKTEITTWNGAPTAEIATPLFVNMLKEALNIDAKILVIERFTDAAILQAGDYQMNRGYMLAGSVLDPYLMWKSHIGTGGSQNVSNYSNPEFDALLAKLESELDPAVRQDLVNQGMDMLDENPPFYHIGFSGWSPIWYNYVKGLNLGTRSLGTNTDSWETAWLDK
jgi:peptide/nickel transport system substrate-binding protein